MKKFIFTFLLATILGCLFSQTSFQRTIGTFGDEMGDKIVPTRDKGYMVLGNLGNYQSTYLVKLDSGGNRLWSRFFALTAVNIIQTREGGYMLCGGNYFGPSLVSNYGFLLKMDSLGNVSWMYSYDNTMAINSVKETLDGTGYAAVGVGGNAPYDLRPVLYKVDLSGNVLWTNLLLTNILNGSGNSFAVTQLKSDSCFYIAGTYARDYFYSGYQIYKVSKQGAGIWAKTILSSNSVYASPLARSTKIDQTFNNHVLLNLVHTDFSSDLVELDSSGQTVQITGFPFGIRGWDFCHPTVDNSVFTTANLYSPAGEDILAAKVNAAGTIAWSKGIGGKKNDYPGDIARCKDKGFIVAGTSANFNVGGTDVYLIKGDSARQVSCHDSSFVFTSSVPTITLTSMPCTFDTLTNPPKTIRNFLIWNPADTIYDACGCVPPKAILSQLGEDQSTWATDTYWNYGGAGYTTSPIPPVFPPNTSTTVLVCLKVTNSCGADSVCRIFSYNTYTLGVLEQSALSPLQFYPNPTSDVINLESSVEVGTLILYNSFGEKIRQLTSKNKQERLDVANLPTGIYFIQVERQTIKFIKE